jgi:large subunit ribosomal protein L3
MQCIIGRKLNMAQHFAEDGKVIPVTLVKAMPNTVTQIRSEEGSDCVAVQLGADEKKALNKAQSGHLKDLPQMGVLREFHVANTEVKRGDTISVDAFEPGTKVDVQGTSKGRGFAGVVKRHGFKGGPATHGNKDQQRMPGSIATHPQGKVAKGKRMGGQMGNLSATVKNLEIVYVDAENNILAIKGAVPGARGGLLLVRARDGENVWQK